ncbi:MAG: hypothetical protein QOH81_2408 [Sphingomonadales bacterium]|nr:hypothetical protein [Sphingomonadales bacterium]
MIEPEPPHEETDGIDDIETLAADADADERRDASQISRLGTYAIPVAIVHLALISVLLRLTFGFSLPPFPHLDLVIIWLLVNGGAVALGMWMWAKGRIPLAAGKWLRGRRARWSVAAWLGLSLAWFLLPALLQDAWAALPAFLPAW